MELGDRATFPGVTFSSDLSCFVMFCLGPFRVLRDRRLERQGAAGGGTLPPFLSLPPTRRGVMVTPRPNAPRARVRGRPTSPSGRSSGFAGGFFQFIISTAVSVRARWKKGQGAAEGKRRRRLIIQKDYFNLSVS